MAMGTRSKRQRQEELWIASRDVVQTPANAFYDRLNQILDKRQFDRHVERICRRYYKGPLGRPSLAPGVYFRLLLIGYFEGTGIGTRHRVAGGGFLIAAQVYRLRAG